MCFWGGGGGGGGDGDVVVGCKPEQQMMYAGSKNKLVQTVELTKVGELYTCIVSPHFMNDQLSTGMILVL